jgi:D-3-phosphoglycerate dehydrogenase
MMVKGKVLIAAPVHPVLTEGLEAEGYQLVSFPEIKQEQAFELIKSCVGVITSTRLQLDAALIDAAPELRWIGRMGSGMEVIDLVHAAKKNIACVASPEGNCNAVAEHALGLLLSLTKNIHVSANEVVKGIWLREENRGYELEGRTIGLIGFGHTGRAFARKLRCMDMRILAFDIAGQSDVPDYVEMCSLGRIKDEAEIISFHVPHGADTYHYFNAAFADEMQHNFWLLNTSRGTVVDTSALSPLLESGKLRGAGLDVWETEPISRMDLPQRQQLDQILGQAKVILTAHIAGYTYEALYKMSATLLQKIHSLSGL